MKQSIKYQFHIANSLTSKQILNGIMILILSASLIVSPIMRVSADTNTEGLQNLTYHLYLPITNRAGYVAYVSPQGNDSNPGTISLPWRTISKAIKTAEPGATIYIRGGTYHEKVSIYQSGLQDMPIRLIAFPGENPIVDGENHLPDPGGALLNIFGDWVEITGLEVQNSSYYGVGLFGKHDTVSKVFAHHNQKIGIYISGDYGTVQDSRVWRNSLINEYGVSSSWSSGLVASRDSENGITEYPIIRRNVVWENWGQGINTHEANQVIIEDNISHDNFTNNIYIHDETNVLCQRNFVYMDPSSYMHGYGENIGIMMGDERNIPSSNITIINNISFSNRVNYALFTGTNVINNILIANNMFVNAVITGGVLFKGNHQNVIFKNNIIQQDGNLPLIMLTLAPDVTFSNNLWSKAPPPEAQGLGDIIGDPLLSRTGDLYSPEWFKLTSLSPAIDGAVSLPEVIVDYFGNIRGSIPDIGANEFIFPIP